MAKSKPKPKCKIIGGMCSVHSHDDQDGSNADQNYDRINVDLVKVRYE